MTNQIIQHLKKSKRVFLASHIHPDGDAIGSTLALGLSLKALGKEVTLYNESLISAVYRFIPSVKWVVNHVTDISVYDCAVIIDCGNIERIGVIAENVKQIPVVINIDHHITNKGFGSFQLVDTTACASAEIIYRLIKKMAIPLTKDIATALYTAILTDTGSFRFSNTNRAAFGICEKMVGLGVDPYDVSQHVYGTYSLGRIKLLNLALDSIEISKNGKLSMMSLTQSMLEETGTELEDGNDLINYARIIEDVKLAVLIQEQKKDKDRPLFHVSLRSDGSVNVADIASSFGGGGHCCAAGFDVNAKLSDIKAEISIIAETL